MNESTKTTTPIALALITSALFSTAQNMESKSTAGFLVTVGWILGIATSVMVLDIIAQRYAIHYRIIREANSITPASKLAESYARLNAESAKAIRETILVNQIEVMAGTIAIFFLATPGQSIERIPMTLVNDFIDRGFKNNPRTLLPLRTWRQGSTAYTQASALTNHLVRTGMAYPAQGNMPAQWAIPLNEVPIRLGLDKLGLIPDSYYDIAQPIPLPQGRESP